MIQPPENQRQIEKLTQNNYPSNLNQLYSLLNYAENQINIFNNHYSSSTNSLSTPIQSLQSLVTYIETITPQKIENLPFKPESTPDFYTLSLQKLVSYLKTLPLEPSQTESQKQKIIEGWLAKRVIDIATLKRQGYDFDPKAKINHLKKPNQLTQILKEITSVENLETWDFFYRVVSVIKPELEKAKTPEEFKKIKKAIDQYNLPENSPILSRLNEIVDQKKEKFKPTKPSEQQKPTEKNQKKNYEKALRESLDYLRYSSLNKNSFRIKLVETTLKILSSFRDSNLTPFTEAWRLAENFWPIRLGRQEVIQNLPKKIKESLKNYYEANLDKSLRTEAAGFWIEKNLNLPNLYTMNNEERIIFCLKNVINTLRLNHPSYKPLRININIDDKHIIKFTFDLSKNIDKQIQSQLQLSSLKKGNLVRLKPEDLFELKQNAYTFGDISKKSKKFQQAFGHSESQKIFGIKTPFSKTESDDYAIRINTDPKKRPKNSPTSLFIVEHHKALFNFDIDGPKVNIAIKFAHKSFDGKPAKDLFLSFIKQLKSQYSYDSIDLPTESENLPSFQTPIFEASASVKFDEILSDTKTDFNPSFIYGLATAIQSGADYFHFLVAGPDIFSDAGPYSNIQPAVVSLIPIKDIVEKIKNNQVLTDQDLKKLYEWRKHTKAEYERAKKGLSTPAVISAVAGRQEKPLSEIAKILGHQGVKLLTNASGMFSALVSFKPETSTERIIFHTAKSDSYQQKINLENPPSSMGVVGFNQSYDINGNVELVFAIRKMPSQGQKEISNWLKNQGIKKFKPFNKLLIAWENLIKGEIKLDQYYQYLQKAYESLPSQTKKSLQGDFKNLQTILNDLLQKSAVNNATSDITQVISIAEKILV